MKIYGTLVGLGMEGSGEDAIARIQYGEHEVIVRNLTKEQVHAIAPLFMETVVLTIEEAT
jgi:hypothetical protein